MLDDLPVEGRGPAQQIRNITYMTPLSNSMKHPALSTGRFVGRCHALGVAAASLTLALGAWAAEIIVPSDSITTIQQAVDAAAPGDTIRVLPGSYDEAFVVTPGLKFKADTESGESR